MSLNVIDKTGKYLDRNSLPIEFSFGFPKVLHYGIDLRESKLGKASEYVVPFFLEMLGLKETMKTQLVSQCLVNIDNLAIQIDSLIDTNDFESTSDLSIEKFDDLETKILNCFSPLSGVPEFNRLITSTLDRVNESFYLNTSKRHLVYSLEKNAPCFVCTTMYLLPLIQYLSSHSERYFEINRIFILMANYIQLLDDFIDVFNDINLCIATPVTEKLIKINNELPALTTFKSSFEVLAYSVKQKLEEFLVEIEQESQKTCIKKNENKILIEWKRFHSEFLNIPVPSEKNNFAQLKYLRDVYNITPPMLCYTLI